jgi:hypothetical protein
MRKIGIALVHHPVLDGAGEVVTTAVTSVDIHDIARSARTYGVDRYYLIHPVTRSRALVLEVKNNWLARPDTPKNRARREALSRLEVVESVDEVCADLGPNTELWSTSARSAGQVLTFASARQHLLAAGPPIVILFGTGNGLAPELLLRCKNAIEPIVAGVPTGYNHLSVRSAVAIVLDRLLGKAS